MQFYVSIIIGLASRKKGPPSHISSAAMVVSSEQVEKYYYIHINIRAGQVDQYT